MSAERDRLVENLSKANDAFDSTLVKLSSGALALSFVFVRQFVGDSEVQAAGLLGAAWVLWIASLTCCLVSHHTSGTAMEEAIKGIDKDDRPNSGGYRGYNEATRWLNRGGGVAFVLATVLAVVFMIRNLVGG